MEQNYYSSHETAMIKSCSTKENWKFWCVKLEEPLEFFLITIKIYITKNSVKILIGGVIGLYILIDLEIHVVFINPSKICIFLNFSD